MHCGKVARPVAVRGSATPPPVKARPPLFGPPTPTTATTAMPPAAAIGTLLRFYWQDASAACHAVYSFVWKVASRHNVQTSKHTMHQKHMGAITTTTIGTTTG